MIAAERKRAAIVTTLIDRGSVVVQKDSRDRSPLFYAARGGNTSVLTSLLKKNPLRNDGSLHEAARELHPQAIKILVKAGHDIHFPSARHGGRSPLCELCFACKGSENPIGLLETMTELNAAKAEPLRKCRGKTALFMAIDNPNPCPIITTLIEVCMWRDLNDPQNVYQEGDYFYSPTSYIKKGITRQPEVVAYDALRVLEDFNTTDRYYAKERMQQPRDAVGMPQMLLDLDHQKWIRSSRLEEEEEDFARKLRRADEEMANRQQNSQKQHLRLLAQRENMAQQQSAHTLDTHLLTARLTDREHGLALMQKEENYDRQFGEMATSNQMRLHVDSAQHATKFTMQQQNQLQRLDYIGQEQSLKLSGAEAQQLLKLDGLSREQQIKLQALAGENELKREHMSDDVRFRESRSNIDRGDLDHRLQHTTDMDRGKVQTSRQMEDIAVDSKHRKNVLDHQNRQSQLQYQDSSDERKIRTQGAMNQYEYEKLSMHQDDRVHKENSERKMGHIQNQTLAEKFDRQLNYQRENDSQKMHTIQTQGRMENEILGQKFDLNLEYQSKSGEIQNATLEKKNDLNLEHEIDMGGVKLKNQKDMGAARLDEKKKFNVLDAERLDRVDQSKAYGVKAAGKQAAIGVQSAAVKAQLGVKAAQQTAAAKNQSAAFQANQGVQAAKQKTLWGNYGAKYKHNLSHMG